MTVQINEALLYMIARDNLPLRTVERDGFIHFCKVALPLYKLPSRKKLTEMIDSKFEILSGVVRSALSSAEWCCLTADVWSDTGNNQSYLGVTAHYPEGSEMKSVALTACPLDQAHTKEYLARMLRDICFEWGINLQKV